MPKYKPINRQIVDPLGVDTSIAPRPMVMGSDDSRNKISKETSGEPLVNYLGKTNPYIDYQSIDILLSLQHPRSDGYDELCFIVMGQVKEMLFKGFHFELVNAQMQIRDGNINNALEILTRAIAYAKYIADTWNVLSTISTEGFSEFRNNLGTASGQLSFMYRHVEFVLGNKSKKLATAHKNVEHVWPEIENSLKSPSLYDDVIALLQRRGFGIDQNMLKRNWAQPYEANASVEAAWLTIYKEASLENDLYSLGEKLTSLDENFSIYRWRHFLTVQKIIGYKPGTGGSAGVGWLENVTAHRFFPELWSIRTKL
ncbi:MAG: tryptophan 2,3-dioxygenase family protein [Planktomarina sp.]|nr:tryptophan 2,3-dioxygenase family protein [Planktomarina sp.]MDV3050831.1 tryptophan 2,3-dioxygenase family protein [Planktomarina sp.]|tara:strand:+ start:2596 stop:3534 length:939 start_codon:yes stop_codon:yes gene_type:complete